MSPIIKTDQNFEKTDQKQINFSLNNRPKTDFLDQKNRLFVKIIRVERSKANPCGVASFAKARLRLCNSSFLKKRWSIFKPEHNEANPCGAASFAKVRLGPCNYSFLIKAFLKALKHFAKIYRRTELCSIPQSVYIVLNKTKVISFISLLNT